MTYPYAMETLNFLLDRPMSLFLVLALGAAIGIGVERITGHFDAQRRKAYWRGRNDAKRKGKGKVVPANLLSAKPLPKPISPPTSSRSSAPPSSPRARCLTGQRLTCLPRLIRR